MIELSIQQQNAINSTNFPTLIIAGAGSGKTRTLIAKFVQLVQSGFDPERILTITFTNKAANEIKNRLTNIHKIKNKNFSWIKTYHSACFNILSKYCELLNFTKPIQLYSTYHQRQMIKKILIQLNIDKTHTNFILNFISNAKNTGTPEKHLNYKYNSIPMLEIYKIYEKKLKLHNAIDFDNILTLTRDLLRNNKKVRQSYQNLFQYILCDEYQDTNNLNEEITKLLLKKVNLFAVGDDWQSIYSFRMSNVNHFLSFKKKYHNAKTFKLEENYRSANKIVHLSNHLIKFNKKKVDKECYSNKRGGTIEIRKFYNPNKETEWIIEKAKELNNIGIPYKQMAILYRTNFCSILFEQILRKYKINYQISGGKSFFDKKEILDLNCYMASAIFEKDDTSFERIINTPKRGIGSKTIKIISSFQQTNTSLKEATYKTITEKILKPKTCKTLSNVLTLLDKIKIMNPDKALNEIIKKTNYIDYINKTQQYHTKKTENIKQLILLASQKETIIEYLEDITFINKNNNETNHDNINLSTIHGAKGLEFDVVFLAGCEEQLFPHWKATTNQEIEEERRLMYVALTRAKKHLYLSSSSVRKGLCTNKSRFINEIKKISINKIHFKKK